MRFEKSCGAVVFRREDDRLLVLLLKQRKGHWSFPKGHVEGTETEEETALREICEESGLEVTLDTAFRQSIVYSPKPDVEKEVVYFVAYADTDAVTIQLSEIEDYCWKTPKEARPFITYENDRRLFDNAVAFARR